MRLLVSTYDNEWIPTVRTGNFYDADPDWFAINSSGNPYKAGDLFVTRINGPYYNELIVKLQNYL